MESKPTETSEGGVTGAVLGCPPLYPFQRQTIESIKAAPWNRWICALGTGLGKTATAITAARELGAERILVCTKAVVRLQWRDQFDLWWPAHPEIGILDMGRKRKSGVSKKKGVERERAYNSPIQIVSYALLRDVEPGPWDLIILDEMHILQGTDTRCTNLLRRIVDNNVGKAVVGLTATLIPNEVQNLWAPLDAMWPDRWGIPKEGKGIPWKFGQRYSNWIVSYDEDTGEKFGGRWSGTNAAYVDELRYRLAQVSTQVTKKEVAHLLPPLTIELLRIKPEKSFKNLEDWKENNASQKVAAVVESLSALPSDVGTVSVGCYLRKTVESIREAINKAGCTRPVFTVTGEELPGERNEAIKRAMATENAILICTMHSMGTGIDSLANCSTVFLAELYDRPADVCQFLGRFHRLSTRDPVTITILALEGTRDEKVAQSLKRKEDDIARLMKTDIAEEQFAAALEKSEEQLIAEMSAAFAEEEEEGYL